MLTMVIALALAAVALYIAIAVWRARYGCASDERREFATPTGRSFLDALLYCGTCPSATSCHRYIEDERGKTGRVKIFCPQSPFLLRLTGRQNR